MNISMTAHAERQIEAKGFPRSVIERVWSNPDVQYPSFRHPGQHKRIGQGICLCCDDRTGKIITVFVHQVETALRDDQRGDKDAVRWAMRRQNRVG